jgi:perosamine synthetase
MGGIYEKNHLTMKPSKKKIAFAGPWITKKELAYVKDGVVNGFYATYDRHIKKLEKTVCEYLGVKYAIATHCCTVALHLACVALDFKEGDEIICTDFSWIATAYAISYTGATPVFVDIDPKTWCIDPKAIERAITKKTKGIMLVHTFGHPADMDAIMAIAKKHKLKVVEDAAPALGSIYKGKKTGTFGDIGCFSFQGAKIAVSGEGGILVTNDEELYHRAKLLANMGRTDRNAVFWSDMLGFQYTIANLTASLALAQVERIEELVEHKRQIYRWYREELDGVEEIDVLEEQPGCRSNYTYPSVFLPNHTRKQRDGIVAGLKDLNVHSRPAFPRMSEFPLYAPPRFDNPVATSVAAQGISLPAAHNMTRRDVRFAARAFKKLVQEV